MDKTDKTDSKAKKAKGKATNQASTSTPTEVLSAEEQEKQLLKAEETIENAINAFWIASDALKKIRDLKLFQKEYENFPEYLAARWGYSESYVSRLVTAGDTRAKLLTDGEIQEKIDLLPTAYSFYYALSGVTPDKRLETLKSLLAELADGGKLTVNKLNELLSPPENKEKSQIQRLSTAISTIKSLASKFNPEQFFKKSGNDKSVEDSKQKFINALRIILEKMEADIKKINEE